MPVRTRNKRIKKFEELLGATYTFDDRERVYVDDNNLAWNVVEVSPSLVETLIMRFLTTILKYYRW